MKAEGKPFGYLIYDRKPNDGVNYYRLKMIDNDGTFSYSKIVTATIRVTAQASPYHLPEPCEQQPDRRGLWRRSNGGQIELTDAAGKLVGRYAFDATRGNAVIDMSSVAAGLYFVKYSDAGHSETIKVTKN